MSKNVAWTVYSLLFVFLLWPLLAPAPVQPRLLDVAARLVRPAPPDEDGQQQDDAQQGTPQLQLVQTKNKYKHI